MAIAKRMKKIREGVDPAKAYPLDEAVKMVKERAKAKFDETIEIAMNLGVDPKHADQMVRGVVTLPNGTGRSVRVGVFARGAKADEAKAAGADVVGAEDLVEKVNGGQIDFDRCIATPDMMGLVGRLGKVLGPRGLMPNPRVGTVTMDVAGAVKGAKGGSVEFRVESAGILQAGVGKASFAADKLVENIKAFADAVNKAKPAGAKGHYINRVSISSTMGPGVKVDMATLGVSGGVAAATKLGFGSQNEQGRASRPAFFVRTMPDDAELFRHYDIGRTEIGALEQKGLGLRDGERIGGAIAEVKTGPVAPFAVAREASRAMSACCSSKGTKVDGELAKHSIEFSQAGHSAPTEYDHAGFQLRHGGSEPNRTRHNGAAENHSLRLISQELR